MKRKILLSVICILAIVLQVQAQSMAKHSVEISWNYFGFNSTYSKNSDKKTFGTIVLDYGYRFNKWIAINGKVGWTHSWFNADANPITAYPKKDNAILILAGCDVYWFQKDILQLHSGVAGGVDIRVQNNNRGSYTTLGLSAQIDAIGLKLNWSRAYIDFAVGWGSLGCIKLGAGINF